MHIRIAGIYRKQKSIHSPFSIAGAKETQLIVGSTRSCGVHGQGVNCVLNAIQTNGGKG